MAQTSITLAKYEDVPQPSSTTPSMDGTAAVGTSAKYAKEDHVHPSDTTRVPTSRTVNGKALSSDITLSASDVNALPSSTTIPTASTTNPSMDGTASYGSGTSYARSNHVHPTDTSRQATLVSGTNIKTINNESLLGSGDITISGGEALTTAEIEDAVDAAFPADPVVTVSLTNSTGTQYFGTCSIYDLENSSDSEGGNTLGYITSIDGSTDVTVPETSYGIMINCDGSWVGESLKHANITCSGGVSHVGFNNYEAKFEVTGNGTITIDGVDWAWDY